MSEKMSRTSLNEGDPVATGSLVKEVFERKGPEED